MFCFRVRCISVLQKYWLRRTVGEMENTHEGFRIDRIQDTFHSLCTGVLFVVADVFLSKPPSLTTFHFMCTVVSFFPFFYHPLWYHPSLYTLNINWQKSNLPFFSFLSTTKWQHADTKNTVIAFLVIPVELLQEFLSAAWTFCLLIGTGVKLSRPPSSVSS